jgi:succinate dehydrogenase flavin-adding protein (antitoxin of CptAB toxin-antitoxin module)
MLYRSKQRGWLELDLLVGMWAERQLPSMDVGMLQSYAGVLEEVSAGLSASPSR